MTAHIGLSAQHVVDSLGHPDGASRPPVSAESLSRASELLQSNHDTWHIFFREATGHNHMAHSILTALALGASPSELERAYTDTEAIQRPIPAVDPMILTRLDADPQALESLLGWSDLYSTFLTYFQSQIDRHGWQSVVTTYVFSETPLAEKLLIKLYEGMYHSLIHLGLGIEFGQPGIIAEALAQAAAHEDGHIDKLLLGVEAAIAAKDDTRTETTVPKSLVQLVDKVRSHPRIWADLRFGDRWNRMRDSIMDRAADELIPIAAQFRIPASGMMMMAGEHADLLTIRTAEMASTAAYLAGASQSARRPRKIDFFLMHTVTASLFFSVYNAQEWIPRAMRVRLVEWKGRLDLAFYAFCKSPELDACAISDYSDDFTRDMDWAALYAAVNQEHDDGHVAKFMRALRHAERLSRPYEQHPVWAEHFPVKGNMWIKLARMALETTRHSPPDFKWIMGTGFDEAWERPDLKLAENRGQQGQSVP
ncbi:questin oxidase family protein [Aspergillus brunneoviolaceus CBS 621.78]|uniref:Uncharacterized protein n=1 Tax=Aspergillus brunneoviolaceus CBS 621.78 TaxID=1450534 RepID=A0ACD1FRZ6_9EURO|nr:hypothetical protein BO95DRAFT_437297 [Aspergillus brunneoviolaceus CBS 621.78]RAH39755.1 hypothetical protein BO95DRAFT_437297 [Aspergillus brunneoviolaceus CBS 621.78]